MKTLRVPKTTILAMLAALALGQGAHGFTPEPGLQLDLQKAPGRFQVLEEFDDEAVLDTRTGLIWERTPSEDTYYWYIAVDFCMTRQSGGHYGWRLPTVEELSSLLDTNNYNRLPWNHPFDVDTGVKYWTQTGVPDYAVLAYAVEFKGYMPIESAHKNDQLGRWCVRSPYAGSQFYAAAK